MKQAFRRAINKVPNEINRILYYERILSFGFVAWLVVMAAVIGSKAQNTGNLFMQRDYWEVYLKQYYRRFTSANCDRNTGCTSTIDFVVPQAEISGVTIFLWILIAPLAAFAYIAVRLWFRNIKTVKDVVHTRKYNEVAYALFVVAELFLLLYLRAAAGDNSLTSFLSLAGLWIALRYVDMTRESIRFALNFAQNASAPTKVVAGAAAVASETAAMSGDVLKAVLMPYSDYSHRFLENTMHVMLMLAPYALFWTAYFVPIGTAIGYGAGRYPYVVAHFTFWAFHMVEQEVLWAALSPTVKATAVRIDEQQAVITRVNLFYAWSDTGRITLWMVKMMSTALMVFVYDVATVAPIVQFNLVA